MHVPIYWISLLIVNYSVFIMKIIEVKIFKVLR